MPPSCVYALLGIVIVVELKNAAVDDVEGVTAYPNTGPPLLCSVPNTVKEPAV